MENEDQDLETLEYLKNLTLLCVEDNKTTQILYDSIFEDIVKEVIFADDGEDGYQKYLEYNNINIIITDYSMPNLNGVEMIEKIRDIDKNIPIILVSAISDIDVITSALNFGVNSFIKKPLIYSEIIKALENTSKILIANQFLQEQRNKKLKELQEKETYNSYQEDLGFAKELNILRNDFYYQMINHTGISLVDFLYHPLDVMSGDAYTARRIDENTTFYLMVDGMGKGLSASLTAMLITSFTNYIVDIMISTDNYDLAVIINETMKYIQPVLLEEEALAIDYIEINNKDNMIYYAKFAMPVLLMENKNKELVRLKSNNPPLCKWRDTFNIDKYDISEIAKFLIYTDGIVENETIFDNQPYSDFIEKDFLNSFTREDLKNSFFEKITYQEDDITLIYINRLNFFSSELATKTFASTLDAVDSANEWYEGIWKDITNEVKLSYQAGVVFTELFMNAYEHGNLGINSEKKHLLLDNDNYFETLLEVQKNCTKEITVSVNKIEHQNADYIITQITDEGEGFDTQILSEIFRNAATFNGRGVFVSRKNSLGIYYNDKGTSVLYLNKVERIS
ncbi:MAG: fused response regulator/phosphatase [Sulfurimonas sp.]|nr:fused response regulator/phosphatase [Sulfurimonas sp.]